MHVLVGSIIPSACVRFMIYNAVTIRINVVAIVSVEALN